MARRSRHLYEVLVYTNTKRGDMVESQEEPCPVIGEISAIIIFFSAYELRFNREIDDPDI